MVGGVRKKFKMTHFTLPNNIFSMKFAPRLVPGLPDVRVPQGDEDGPRPPRWLEGKIGESTKVIVTPPQIFVWVQ